MDFRSQLSAFKSGGGGASRGSGDGYQDRNRPPNRQSPHGRGRDHRDNYYGRGGNDGDRRRPRGWNNQPPGPPNARRRFHSPDPDRDGLGDLRHFGYRIPRGLPPAPTPEERSRKTKHVALLVLCIEELPYEHIWKAWSQTLDPKGNDDYYISLVCHSKFPQKVTSQWLKQRLLVHPPKSGRGNSYLDPQFLTRTPSWGSVDITRAMLDLLQAGLKIGRDKEADMRFAASRFLIRQPPLALDAQEEVPIPPVDQFLFVSESCVPITTAQEFFDQTQDATVSWVNARHRKDDDTPRNGYENDQFAGIHRRIPGQFRWKADQWVLICKSHASQIANMDLSHIPPKHQLWQSFRDVSASDEMYFPTCLALLGLLRLTATGEDTQRSRSNNPTDDQSRGRSNSATSKEDGNSQSPPPVDYVLKRPVTYTDWTEGMRNPAAFTKGKVDFKRVAKLARDKGCLVARKFAPFVTIPGVSKEDSEITGQITAEEWKAEVASLDPMPEAPTQALPTPEPEVPKEVAQDSNGDKEPEESFIGGGQKETVDEKQPDEEEDDEEGETQLE